MIDEAPRRTLGITPRKISDEEIVERLVYALVNEGAKILEEGIAQRASDIDMVYLTGYGFPLWRGGPMLYADTVGLFNVVRAMARASRRNPLRRRRRSGSRRRCLARLAAERQGVQLINAAAAAHDLNGAHDEAVIVSTARTPLAKSWRGAFNMTHGATLGGHVVKAALERARHRPGRGRGRAHGLRHCPRARPAATSRARSRCAPACR